MASNSSRASQLTVLCAVASFLWLARNLEGHRLIEQPRLSSLLILFIAGVASFASSFFAEWLPGANGRFDDDLGPLKVARANLPKKPRRYFLPGLVVCIVLRLELFHRVTSDLQCSSPGIEACLPLVVLFYELLPGRRRRSGSKEKTDVDDMGQTGLEHALDFVGSWIGTEAKIPLTIGILALVCGTYMVSSHSLKSTFFCSTHDSSSLVVSLQWLGLVLDGIMAILYWRILAWARTTKHRLRTLSGILLASSVATALLYLSFRLFHQARPMHYHFRGLGSLYIFDVVVDGFAFSAFFISTALIVAEASPLSLAGIVTFLSGLLLAVHKIWLLGSWENVSFSATYSALILICVGFPFFVYTNNIRSVVFIHRALVIFLLLVLLVAAAIYTAFKGRETFGEHPLQRLIYDKRVEADRWRVTSARVSNSLPVAVEIYKERHDGRAPPPKFETWYYFAKEKSSEILDDFAQIHDDILPFWGMAPEKIRQNIHRVAAEPGIAVLKIRGGTPTHNIRAHSPHQEAMRDLIDMIKPFAQHLPDMELAINLDDRPRVLAPWEDVSRFKAAAKRNRLTKLLPGRSDSRDQGSALQQLFQPTAADQVSAAHKNFTSAKALREMVALTCPPGSKARSGVHWDVRDFCYSCARPQSKGQFLSDWSLSQDLCHQSDLLRLHSFHMTASELRPLQELLPVFSRSKTDSYSDILIPMRRVAEIPDGKGGEILDVKWKKLYWRGKVDRRHLSRGLLHGGHQERLVHAFNNASAGSDTVTAVLPVPVPGNGDRFVYGQVSTAGLNALLPVDIGFSSRIHSDSETCSASSTNHLVGAANTTAGSVRGSSGLCDDAASVATRRRHEAEFGTRPVADPLRFQYVLVMDTDTGPPADFLRTLRSGSVPFYASIFREWFTDRLTPWVHFVPVDLRFHALHSTLAYFAGVSIFNGPAQQTPDGQPANTPAAAIIDGRHVNMNPHDDDARWIADEGRRWAAKAVRREDMQVYLFRLLLEWGRVVDDRRDELAFVLQ
ncbi:glycosyltransferase family 90 protein [Lasiosphaeria ovina]|uniref:Glycosyltransferase family 90 protein n=1 Tax=Lasiosphaeria ovina TaxID=92902 RepID=A0AAE0NKI3_9PEZI|nr:glycosyltransferase family 90 protein [Lasiosphaeria ovina]